MCVLAYSWDESSEFCQMTTTSSVAGPGPTAPLRSQGTILSLTPSHLFQHWPNSLNKVALKAELTPLYICFLHNFSPVFLNFLVHFQCYRFFNKKELFSAFLAFYSEWVGLNGQICHYWKESQSVFIVDICSVRDD
jgi:hypothetical protein